MPVETTQDRYDTITEHAQKVGSAPDAVAQVLKEAFPEPAKATGVLVDHPDYLSWKHFRPGARLSHVARYWNLTSSNNSRLVQSLRPRLLRATR